jgi:hypothetical protein
VGQFNWIVHDPESLFLALQFGKKLFQKRLDLHGPLFFCPMMVTWFVRGKLTQLSAGEHQPVHALFVKLF